MKRVYMIKHEREELRDPWALREADRRAVREVAGYWWQDREANRSSLPGAIQAFCKTRRTLLLELRIIKTVPDTNALIDTRFIK